MNNFPAKKLAVSRWMSQKVDWLSFVVMVIVFTAYFYPILIEDNILVYKDIVHFAYPMKWYIWKIWKLGEWPFWHTDLFQGTPFLPLMHPGTFYPPSAFFLLEDFNQAFNSYFLFHHLVLMFSVYALSRYWGVSKIASVVSAITALLGGYFLSLSSMYNHFHSAVWFPLIQLFYQKYIEDKRTIYLLFASILIAFQILSGGPESAILSISIAYCSSIFCGGGGRILKKTVQMSAVILLALGMSAIQWIPTYHFLEHLTRGQGISFSYSTESSMDSQSLADMILPENTESFFDVEREEKISYLKSIYMGLIPCFILLMSTLRIRKDPFARFWIATFLIGIFFSLGKNNPAYFYFHSWFPFFDLFRYPPKFFFLSAFALVFLSGRGLDQLADDLSKRKIGWNIPLVILFILVVLVALVFNLLDSPQFYETLVILGLVALGCLALFFDKINCRTFLTFFLLLLVLDLMGKNVMLVPFIEKNYYKQTPALAERIGQGANKYRVFRDKEIKVSRFIYDFGSLNSKSANKKTISQLDRQLILRGDLHNNLGTIYGIAYADGKAGMLLKDSALWESIYSASSPDRKKIILMRSNVKYRVKDDYAVLPSSASPEGIKNVETFSEMLPRAFLVGEFVHDKAPHLLNTYYDTDFDPLKKVLLSEKATWHKSENFSGRVERIDYGANRVRIETSQNAEGMLVLLDTYFPGWKVKIDGKPDQIFRANYFYRGVRLNAGRHVVEFSYAPEGLQTGLRVTCFTLILILARLLFNRFRISK